MQRLRLTLFIFLASIVVPVSAADEPSRKVRLGELDPSVALPADLAAPEGKSRWHLESAVVAGSVTRSWTAASAQSARVDVSDLRENVASQLAYTDPDGGDAALRWTLPERFAELLKPGARTTLRIEERRAASVERLWIELEQIGIGWLHLPSGARETVLQRARVFRATGERSAYVPDEVIHRWIDPRAGVVAEVHGSASPDGRRRIDIDAAFVVEELLEGATPMKMFVDAVDFAPRTLLNYGWGKQEVCVDGSAEGTACTQDSDCPGTRATCGAYVSSITAAAPTNIGQLLAANSWDFSPSVASCVPGSPNCKEIVQGNVELNSSETCNADPNQPPGLGFITCGYQGEGRVLGRQDQDPADGDWIFGNQVTEREQRVNDVTVWLRAGAQKEAVTGGFGAGETRFCYDPDEGKPEMALYRFPHEEPGQGWYFQVGDGWQTTLGCDQVLYSTGISSNAVCGEQGTIGLQRAGGQPDDGSCSRAGEQRGEVLKEGVLTLPTGHTLNTVLVRTVADFCVYNDCNCGGFLCGAVAEVLTDTLTWQAPHFGTVALFMSKQDAGSLTGYDKLAIADIRVGHFPPVSITTGAIGADSVELSWDPGNQTHRIDAVDGFNVYWDTVSGASSGGNYANSTTVSGSSTAIGGLDVGTTYYFTVTSNSTYASPSNPGNPTTYESLKYPSTVSGDPSFVYPVEVQATTGCAPGYVPSSEVTGLSVDKSGGGVEICWDSVHLSEACVEGYRILGADSPESDAGFSTVTDVGLTTCWSGASDDEYFLAVTRASGGTGPWGHFGN